MQQVATCPDCNAFLALPGEAVEIDGSLTAQCPTCDCAFPLTVDRLAVLPSVTLTPTVVEPPAPVEVPPDTPAAADLPSLAPTANDTDANDTEPPPSLDAAPMPTLAELLDRRPPAPAATAADEPASVTEEPATSEGPFPSDTAASAEPAVAAPMEPSQESPLSRDFTFDLQTPSDSETPTPNAGRSDIPLVVPQQDEPAIDFGAWRQAALAAAGVFSGLVVGYYFLLVLGGPSRDALNVASVLPGFALPASFSDEASDTAVVEPRRFEETTGEDAASMDALSNARMRSDAATVPASFTEPAPTPITSPALWARMADTPRFGVERLTAALEGADDASAVLGKYTLAEPDGLQQVGLAYAKLCELAQVVTLLDADSSHPDMMITRLDAEDLYRRLFRSEHVRGDSRQIASRWIAWPGRPHGGVFFSGLPLGPPTSAGEGLYRYELALADGESVPVISPEMFRLRRFKGAEEMMIIGCVVDSPRGQINGYDGDDPRVVWRATSIKLKLPDLP